MAVIEYLEGQHSSGFIGIRVVSTVGGKAKPARQRYFSYSEYHPTVAKLIANSLDCAWTDEGEEYALEQRLAAYDREKGIIAKGFIATIKLEKCSKTKNIQYNPCFTVAKRNPRGVKAFYIRNGYHKSFGEAVEFYARSHNLSFKQKERLYRRVPDKSIFYTCLKDKLVAKGHDLSTPFIKERMGL